MEIQAISECFTVQQPQTHNSRPSFLKKKKKTWTVLTQKRKALIANKILQFPASLKLGSSRALPIGPMCEYWDHTNFYSFTWKSKIYYWDHFWQTQEDIWTHFPLQFHGLILCCLRIPHWIIWFRWKNICSKPKSSVLTGYENKEHQGQGLEAAASLVQAGERNSNKMWISPKYDQHKKHQIPSYSTAPLIGAMVRLSS